MNTADVFDEPARRRWWLLSKALEGAPLPEALRLARAADEFLMSGRCEAADALELLACRHAVPEIAPEPGLCAAALAAPVLAGPYPDSAAGMTCDCHEHAIVTGLPDPCERAGDRGEPLGAPDDSIRQPAGDCDAADALAAGAEGLAVLASPEEVVRYLRQQDDVVISKGAGEFLVNGRFEVDLGRLVERANRMRVRQGKPPFQLIPAGLNGTGDGAACKERLTG